MEPLECALMQDAGECKSVMTQYLRCIRAHRGTNDEECRQISKAYLQCRMERNLMAPDEMKNLGYHDEPKPAPEPQSKGPAQQ
ncbi:Cytochrome c oxidase assembly protein cox19 [Diplodia intermedia]|uniref:Cytochrome c oxidase assembly protein cox19 n=1 Tax=Diplodia intermedia TaxID=856260 RepID=A0ABR3TUW5_9PEZI